MKCNFDYSLKRNDDYDKDDTARLKRFHMWSCDVCVLIGIPSRKKIPRVNSSQLLRLKMTNVWLIFYQLISSRRVHDVPGTTFDVSGHIDVPISWKASAYDRKPLATLLCWHDFLRFAAQVRTAVIRRTNDHKPTWRVHFVHCRSKIAQFALFRV